MCLRHDRFKDCADLVEPRSTLSQLGEADKSSPVGDAKLLNNLSAGRSSHPDANSRQLRGFCDQARLAQIEFTLELTQQFITDTPLIAELNGSIAFHTQQFA
jgi:hypothetical protein